MVWIWTVGALKGKTLFTFIIQTHSYYYAYAGLDITIHQTARDGFISQVGGNKF